MLPQILLFFEIPAENSAAKTEPVRQLNLLRLRTTMGGGFLVVFWVLWSPEKLPISNWMFLVYPLVNQQLAIENGP